MPISSLFASSSASPRALSQLTREAHTRPSRVWLRSLCLIVTTLFFTSVAIAQPTDSSAPSSSPALSGLPLPDQGPMLSPDTGVRAGQWSLAIALPWGGAAYSGFDDSVSSLGIWRLISDEVALGLFTGLRLTTEDILVDATGAEANQTKQRTSSELVLSPGVKYYTYQKGPVALFGLAQAHVRFYSDGDQATTTDKDPSTGETYNPAEDIKLRAHLGFGAEWFPTTSFSLAGHFGLQLDLLQQGNQGFALETFTSGLSAQIYF